MATRPSVTQRADRVSLRRGLVGLLMTLVLPGSVQLAAGNRTVGRIALRTWAVLWSVLAVVGVVALVRRSAVISLASTSWLLGVLQVALVVLGVGWAVLFADAWRLGRPIDLAPRHRPGYALLTAVLVFTVLGGSIGGARTVAAHQDLVDHLFAGGGTTETEAGRYNILLLGGDAGQSRVGLRPDSITVASVAADTGRTVLFSLPRNLEDVPFPADSPMRQQFPDGFTCPEHECMLNAVYTWASEHPELYPDAADPGAQATKEAVEEVTGLTINYYAMVDLHGFEALIDAVGGIRMDISQRVPIGGGTSPITGWIEPGRNVHLDGYHALWFARSREGSSDYVRMARQKCVMAAMLKQLDPATVLTKFGAIAEAGERIAVTDVPQSETGTLLELALKAKDTPIASVSFVPPLIHPGEPDFGRIRQVVAESIARSEAADEATPSPETSSAAPGSTAPKGDPSTGTPSGTPSAGGGATGGTPTVDTSSGASASSGGSTATSAPPAGAGPSESTNQVDDLGVVCRAR